jgi:hypothetical protein
MAPLNKAMQGRQINPIEVSRASQSFDLRQKMSKAIRIKNTATT